MLLYKVFKYKFDLNFLKVFIKLTNPDILVNYKRKSANRFYASNLNRKGGLQGV
jgi:hypothetical protein